MGISKYSKLTEIVTLLKNRDEKGLSMLYDKYASSLLGIIVRVVRNKDIGEEVLQQCMLKAWNNISFYNAGRGTFFTWLATIARNTAIDQIRLKGYQNHDGNKTIDPSEIQIGFTSSPTDEMDAKKLLGELDEKYKSVLDLIYLQGHTQSSTAEILNIPLGTVKTRVKQAIDLLREELKGERGLFSMVLFFILIILLLWV